MADTIISANLPPLIDPTRTTYAYGNLAIHRLNRELREHNLLTQQRAANSLSDYLKDPEHIASALTCGIPEALKILLFHTDVTVRAKAAENFYIIACHAIGREAMLVEEVLLKMSGSIKDPDELVRKNVHMAIEMYSEMKQGACDVLDKGFVPILIGQLGSEPVEIKCLILDTLHFCMLVDSEAALMSDGLQEFHKLIIHPNEIVRAKACRNMFDVCRTLDGKNLAVREKVMDTLVGKLSDSCDAVKCFAACAISIIVITTKGKYAALGAEAIDALMPLVDDLDSETRANALKALTSISEAPEGRHILLEENNLSTISKHLSDPIPNVKKHAEIAHKVITWVP